MPPVFATVTVLLAVVGLAAGVIVVLLSRRTRLDTDGFRSVRVEAELRDGVEQTLIALTRRLDIPLGSQEVAYGHLFIEQHDDNRLLVQTRSQLNRGFVGIIDVTRTAGTRTRVRYALLRLPADETVRDQVRQFEVSLIHALRQQGATDSLRMTPAALRELRDADPTRTAQDLLPPPPTDD